MRSNVDPLIEAVYTRPQIHDFLEKTDPKAFLDLQKVYLTTNPLDPNMGRKLEIFGWRLPSTWNKEMEPSRNGKDPVNFVKVVIEECRMVQGYYIRHMNQFPDIKTLDGQKRLANETGALGSSIVCHLFKGQQDIALNLAKGWLALAKALNNGDFGVDAIVCLSFARFDRDNVSGRLKIQATSEPTAEMFRKIEMILQSVPLKCSLKIKTDVATYLNDLTRKNKWPRVIFERPCQETWDVKRLTEQLDGMRT